MIVARPGTGTDRARNENHHRPDVALGMPSDRLRRGTLHRDREQPALLTVHDVAVLLGITPCAVRTAITRHEIPWIRSATGARGIPADFQQHRTAVNEARDIALRGAVTFMLAIAATLVVALAVGVLPLRNAASTVDYRDLTPNYRQQPACARTADPSSLADVGSGIPEMGTNPCGP